MACFYIRNAEGKFLGLINKDKVIFNSPMSISFQKRQSEEKINLLKARAESLGAKGLVVMKAETPEEAMDFMRKTYGSNCDSQAPRRGRPRKAFSLTETKPVSKPVKVKDAPKRFSLSAKVTVTEKPKKCKVAKSEKEYIASIKDKDTREMFDGCGVNSMCMKCSRNCKQTDKAIIYQCPQFDLYKPI